jgi:hypothetical protein
MGCSDLIERECLAIYAPSTLEHAIEMTFGNNVSIGYILCFCSL